jgi:hypothetical protein
MSFADPAPQAIFGLRHRNQVNVIGHEAVCPDHDPSFPTPLGHQFDVGRIIFVVKERPLPTVPALGYVMRQAGNDQSC